MKKIVFGLVGLFIASQLMVSCSADNELLSQFSKRKYLKKFKAKDVKYEDKIGKLETELAFTEAKKSQTEKTIVASTNETIESSTVQLENKVEAVQLSADKKEQLTKVKTLVNDYSEWNKYNRATDFSGFETENKFKHLNNYENFKSNKASEVLIAILCIFLPPVAVILFEDTVTTNFWVSLLLTLFFWLPGIIFAFLVCFADVSL